MIDLAKHKKEAIRKEETKTLQFIVGGVVILAIVLLGLLFYKSQPANPEQTTVQDMAVAKVNDQTILQSQLDAQYNKLPEQFKAVLTKEQVLGQMIDEALLLQNAKQLGIQISDADVQKKLESFLQESKIDKRVFEESLQRQGISQQEVMELFRKQLTLQTLLEQKFAKSLSVSDKEILDYYNANIQDYKIPPSTKVRHILIAFGNMTPEETQAQAQKIRDLIKPDSSNFCEFVQKYSADKASFKTCGEYTYSADTQLVPEFKKAGEKQAVNQISLVKTQFGYHILQTLAKLPERIPKLADVKEDITTVLKNKKQRDALKDYVAQLHKQSHIENLLTNQTSEPTVNAQKAAPQSAPVQAAPAPSSTPSEAQAAAPSMNTFALCLAKKATLYGAKTDAQTQKQLKLFGDAANYLNYVECSYLGNPNVIMKECSQKGVSTFPTWIVNGVKASGFQTLEQLTAATGCGA